MSALVSNVQPLYPCPTPSIEGGTQGGTSFAPCPTFPGEGANKGANGSEPVRTPRIAGIGGSLETWISAREAAELTGLSKRQINRACGDRSYIARKATGNGGVTNEILLSTLPMSAQIAYWQQRAIMPVQAERPAAMPQLSERARNIALRRLDLLRLYVEDAERSGYGSITQRKELFVSRFNAGSWPELLVELKEITFKTLERWRKTLDDAGGDWTVLAPRYGSDGAQRKERIIAQVEKDTLLSFALTPHRLRESEIIRLTRQELDNRGVEEMCSDMTYRRFLKDWKKENIDLWTFSRDGQKALNDGVLPYLERDRWQIEAGDVVVADGHTLNFDVINPFTGKGKRMTLVCVLDFHSGLPLGWEIMPTENVQTIAAAYRGAIMRLGFAPRCFYLDNGRAFRAKYFKGCKDFSTAGLSGLFERLGSIVHHAQPYHGQSKPIERFFGSMAEVERLTPTYRGTSIDRKPAYLLRGEKHHRDIREELAARSMPTIQEAYATIESWFAEYAQRPQQGLRGATPIEVYAASIARVKALPDYERRCVAPGELNLLMMAAKVATLQRNGIAFNGGLYFNEELYRYEKGSGRTRFVIRYDIHVPDRILVYTEEGAFVGVAERTKPHHPMLRLVDDPDGEARLAADLARKRALQSETVNAAKTFMRGNAQRHIADLPFTEISTGSDAAPALPETPFEPASKPHYDLFEDDVIDD